jgi:penicillin amidase
MRPMAERIVATLSERDRRFLDDYARGVNAFIAAHQDNLPAEFGLLMYKPKPWRPVDSVLILLGMVQMEDERWEHQARARAGRSPSSVPRSPPSLYPVGSWRDHPPTAAVPDLTAPRKASPTSPSTNPKPSSDRLLTHPTSPLQNQLCQLPAA